MICGLGNWPPPPGADPATYDEDDPETWGDEWIPCCTGSAVYGPSRCTCWRAVFDVEQADPVPGERATRVEQCSDCAYRKGSPELAGEDRDALIELALRGHHPFSCHVGTRRAIEYRHPDGRTWSPDAGAEVPMDYQPPVVDGIAYKADGSPADICAGWARIHDARMSA